MNKAGKLVLIACMVVGGIFVAINWPPPQQVTVPHTVIIQPPSVDEAEKVEPEDADEIIIAPESADLEDMVLMPDESSQTYQEEFANAEKAMQNP